MQISFNRALALPALVVCAPRRKVSKTPSPAGRIRGFLTRPTLIFIGDQEMPVFPVSSPLTFAYATMSKGFSPQPMNRLILVSLLCFAPLSAQSVDTIDATPVDADGKEPEAKGYKVAGPNPLTGRRTEPSPLKAAKPPLEFLHFSPLCQRVGRAFMPAGRLSRRPAETKFPPRRQSADQEVRPRRRPWLSAQVAPQ